MKRICKFERYRIICRAKSFYAQHKTSRDKSLSPFIAHIKTSDGGSKSSELSSSRENPDMKISCTCRPVTSRHLSKAGIRGATPHASSNHPCVYYTRHIHTLIIKRNKYFNAFPSIRWCWDKLKLKNTSKVFTSGHATIHWAFVGHFFVNITCI